MESELQADPDESAISFKPDSIDWLSTNSKLRLRLPGDAMCRMSVEVD